MLGGVADNGDHGECERASNRLNPTTYHISS